MGDTYKKYGVRKYDILDFIKRRFSGFSQVDNDTIDNSYYFALILKDRFPGGIIYYEVTDEHFIYMYDGVSYDCHGQVAFTGNQKFVCWDVFDRYDAQLKEQIIKDCIM